MSERGGERGPRGERGPTGDHGQEGEPGARGRRGRVPRAIAVSFLVVALLLAAVLAVLSREIQRNSTALDALCAQRADLDVRITRTEKILAETPGPMVFGIPRGLIVDGLRQSRITRKNLDILDC